MILGGLLSATALNMLVLPALYWLSGERVVAPETARGDLLAGDVAPAPVGFPPPARAQ